MKARIFISIILVIVVGVFLVLNKPELSTAEINGRAISLIVVDTPQAREAGLGGRMSLPEDSAMLFVFDKPDTYGFWMKNMKFPIDIIWLDSDFKIVHIESNSSPNTYPNTTFYPDVASLYILETNAFFAQKNDLKVGDVVNIVLKK